MVPRGTLKKGLPKAVMVTLFCTFSRSAVAFLKQDDLHYSKWSWIIHLFKGVMIVAFFPVS